VGRSCDDVGGVVARKRKRLSTLGDFLRVWRVRQWGDRTLLNSRSQALSMGRKSALGTPPCDKIKLKT